LAALLQPQQRAAFMEAVTRQLAGPEIGDGSVHLAALLARQEVLNGDY